VSASGLHPTFAHNGREAVELTAAHDYDLTLMDIKMPELDGVHATLAIRQQSGGRDMPIVAMTGNALGEAGMHAPAALCTL